MQQTSTYQSGHAQPYNSQIKYHLGRVEDEIEGNGVGRNQAPATIMNPMIPQSPHNVRPVVQQERLSPNEKAPQQFTQSNTQLQTQTNMLPAHMLGQQQLLNQDGQKMMPGGVIPIDQYGYPEGYKHERDITPLIFEEKSRLRDRFFRGIGRISLLNALILLSLSFAVFWIQLGYMLGNGYYRNGQQNGSMVGYRKNQPIVNGVYSSWNNDSDTNVASYFMTRDLAGIWISVLDQLCLYGILLINLYVIQYRWTWFLFFVNLVLAGKDIAVIVAWSFEQHNRENWTFYRGISAWGFAFLRRPLGLPVTLALLNLFILRLPMLGLGCADSDADIDTEADLYAEPAAEPGFFMKYIGFPLTRFGKLIMLAYLTALFILLIVNFFVGLLLVLLGIFGFFTIYFFYFLTTYTIPFINAKYAVRNRWYAKNYYLLVRANCRHDLIDNELHKAIRAHRDFRHRDNVLEYPKMLLYFVMFTFCVQYGSVWLRGGCFTGLMRWIYASPFQFTFSVLTSNVERSWYYVFRWLSAI